MRPLKLEFEGFGTFRDRTVVDFTDLDLVAFVGATGSGKSTVIDAMTFALYGSVARYDNPALVAPVIHQLATEAKVRFDFELGGATYTAVRVVRRLKSKPGAAMRASTREARLELIEGEDGELSTVLAGNVSELDEAVSKLIGLDFSQFTRTIVLPQGDFAEFLKDDPRNRQKLLRRLLDIDVYAQMGARARERAVTAAQQHEVYGHELERLADTNPERLTGAEAVLAGLNDFAALAQDRLTALAAVEVELTDRRDRVNAIDRELAGLATLAVPEGLEATDAIAALAKTRLAEAEVCLIEARTERDRAEAELAAVGDPVEIDRGLELRRRRNELADERVRIDAERTVAEKLHDELQTDLAAATEHHDGTARTAREARIGADAAVWVARLVAGDPCPICRQVVTDVPNHIETDEAETAERQVEHLAQAVAEATTATARARGRLESLEAGMEANRVSLAEIDVALEGIADLDELSAQRDRARQHSQDAKTAAEATRTAEAAMAAAADELTVAEMAEDRFRSAFTSQRDVVAEFKPPAPSSSASLVENWRGLLVWGQERAEVLGGEREDVAAAGKTAAAAKGEIVTVLQAEAQPLGLDAEPSGLEATIAAATARAEAEIERLRERLDHKAELVARVAELAETRSVNEALGRQHLSANGFERWLLAEALEDIVARATEVLLQLSDGRYSLEADDGSFAVRDHGNADERRDVRTLSGGEVFLASLALALALASSIAELAPVDSPRMESIFLDEGFGTLDGETLDILASAIEELSAGGRLVAIVTHVRDLAERMPVRFEVRKGSSTSTIERTDL